MKRRLPSGSNWTVLALGRHDDDRSETSLVSKGASVLTELTLDGWLHVEKMDAREWWVRVGEIQIDVRVGRDGRARAKVRA